jgi:hypothetical protein
MVQYFSQVQRSSGWSHIAQTTGPGMGASEGKLYLSRGRAARHAQGGVVDLTTTSLATWMPHFRARRGFFDASERAC